MKFGLQGGSGRLYCAFVAFPDQGTHVLLMHVDPAERNEYQQ
jgi:hypothetical protein